MLSGNHRASACCGRYNQDSAVDAGRFSQYRAPIVCNAPEDVSKIVPRTEQDGAECALTIVVVRSHAVTPRTHIDRIIGFAVSHIERIIERDLNVAMEWK